MFGEGERTRGVVGGGSGESEFFGYEVSISDGVDVQSVLTFSPLCLDPLCFRQEASTLGATLYTTTTALSRPLRVPNPIADVSTADSTSPLSRLTSDTAFEWGMRLPSL